MGVDVDFWKVIGGDFFFDNDEYLSGESMLILLEFFFMKILCILIV